MFFFRRTNKGGGKNNDKCAKINPFGVLIQRRALWMLGIADLILDQCQKDKDFDLEDLLPGFYLAEEVNEEMEDIEEFHVH